jgi:hypothetical protein
LVVVGFGVGVEAFGTMNVSGQPLMRAIIAAAVRDAPGDSHRRDLDADLTLPPR